MMHVAIETCWSYVVDGSCLQRAGRQYGLRCSHVNPGSVEVFNYVDESVN